jgi:hypothetical protein
MFPHPGRPQAHARAQGRQAVRGLLDRDVSSDREYLVDLLAQAYAVLLSYGVQNSANMDRVLMMDAIKLELEFNGETTEAVE